MELGLVEFYALGAEGGRRVCRKENKEVCGRGDTPTCEDNYIELLTKENCSIH